jgi:endonuclease YncB( thermonuclease family)
MAGSVSRVRRRARENLVYLAVVVLLFAAVWGWNRWQDSRVGSAGGAPSPTADAPPGAQRVTVDFALDGDSLQVISPEAGPVVDRVGPVPIRLLGIDAPEMHGPDGQPQCFARDAYERLQRLAPAGSTLWLTADVQRRDPYDRYLVYAWTPRGLFVNLEQARLGYARVLDLRPNEAYAVAIGSAAAEAQGDRRGLWGACVGAEPPP